MKFNRGRKITAILLAAIPLLIACILYFFVLPQQIPIQFTTNGTRYADKAFVFLFAVIPVLIYLKYASRTK